MSQRVQTGAPASRARQISQAGIHRPQVSTHASTCRPVVIVLMRCTVGRLHCAQNSVTFR